MIYGILVLRNVRGLRRAIFLGISQWEEGACRNRAGWVQRSWRCGIGEVLCTDGVSAMLGHW